MPQPRPVAYTPTEGASYTLDMLVSLRKIALQQGQTVLAHLLYLAAVEAKVQADQDTSLPG
jgi:hypothetical protein